MEIGKRIDLQLVNIKSDGQGVAYTNDGKIVLIDGVNDGDGVVIAEVTKIMEETLFAKKITRKESKKEKEVTSGVQNPYELDDDEGMDDDEDDDD